MSKFTLFVSAVWAGIFVTALLQGQSASADPREVEKLRQYYKSHNLDFYGDLIADQGDFLTDEKKKAKLELLADDARSKALEQLDKLLKGASSEMRAELLMRRATLLGDRSRTASYFQNSPYKTSRLKDPKTYLDQSIRTFREVEAQYPNHPRMDTVLFSIGYNYAEMKDQSNALLYYEKLVKRFPDSPLIGDARLSIAEIQFDRRKFGDALIQLKEIVRADHPRLKNFALYKMAWTYYNMSDLDSAMNALERVVDGVNAAGVQRARLELRKEALHDLVTFYSEKPENSVPGGAAAGAGEYFERVGKTPDGIVADLKASRTKRLETYALKKQPIPDEDREEYQLTEPSELLIRLAALYSSQGKHEQLLLVSDKIISKLGKHPKAPPFYRMRAEAAEKLHRRDQLLAELERLGKAVQSDLPQAAKELPKLETAIIQTYATKVDSDLALKKLPAVDEAKYQPLTPDEVTFTDPYQQWLAKVALDTFNEFTTFLHGEWNKTKGAETARIATGAYNTAVQALLTPWRGHKYKTVTDLRFHRAHLFAALDSWDLAAADYQWIAEHVADATGRDEATLGEIGALESWLKTDASGKKRDEIQQRLIGAYDRYLALHLTTTDPKQRETTARILSASSLLYKDRKKTDFALPRLSLYARFFSDQSNAVAATRDVLAILESQSKWRTLRDFSALLLTNSRYIGSAAEKELSHSNEYASLKLLEELENNKEWKEATHEFADFAEKHPTSPFTSQALMKSAMAAIELKDTELSIARLEKATAAPDRQIQLQAWLALEPYYRRGFQWPRLIQLYNSVLKLNPDAKTVAATKKNLEAIHGLEAASFKKQTATFVEPDAELSALTAKLAHFDTETAEFRKLRFTKSNKNPEQNFKRKADMHSKLASAVDKLVKQTPDRLRGPATLWANIVKTELLLELADTLQNSAMPAVLLQATDNDRKAYQEIIAGQVKEVREKAASFAADSEEAIAKLDNPLDLETRLNKVLEAVGRPERFERAGFAEVWNKRPAVDVLTKARDRDKDDLTAAEVNKLGLRILLNESDAEKSSKALFDLANLYLAMGEPGFAYALAGELLQKKGLEAVAFKLRFALEVERLPSTLKPLLDGKDSAATMMLRWDLARWLAAYKSAVAKVDGITEQEKNWFGDAIRVLLRAQKKTK